METPRIGVPGTLPPTLVRLSQAESEGSLVFCPDIGGNVIYSRLLVQALSSDVSSFGLRLTAEMVADLARLSVSQIAQRFATEIVASSLPRPIHVIGFSFAAMFASATAFHLSEMNCGPERLWILDMRARRRVGPKRLVRYAWANRRRILGLDRNTDVVPRLGFIELNLSRHPESYREIIRRLYDIVTRFRPHPLKCNVTIVATEETCRLPGNRPDLEWGRLVSGELGTAIVPGDHLGIVNDPEIVAIVADLIRTQAAIDATKL